MDATHAAPIFRIEGVAKRFGGVRALENANLTVEAGKIHGILGENGAGKSTLIKIIAGVVQPDEGRLELDGAPVTIADPRSAYQAGIACIFQELSLIPDLSVADNIAISDPPRRFGMIDRRAQRRFAEAALARAGAADIHPMVPVRDLPLSRRQMVEIAKSLARSPRILILDEATSALTAEDVAKVFDVLKRLRSEGLALLYISHRMHEIDELADECTVFRNGQNVVTFRAGTRTSNEIVEMMIGREFSHAFPAKPDRQTTQAAPAITVSELNWAGRLKNISFSAEVGEIVGLGGLDGQGQRELLLALFGVLSGQTGRIEIAGRQRRISGPRSAKRRDVRMALIPEDRKTEGLLLAMPVGENLTLANLDSISRFGIIDRARETEAIGRVVKLLDIKAGSLDAPVGSLSGGNQQKVVIAKWLMIGPRIILLNDPTRGIDVGTKQEIYRLLRELADNGATILFYSTDYDELIGCCDRVLVMYDGSVVRSLAGSQISERELIGSALNLPTQKDDQR